jgi:tRNA threonylcarbamoyladenosine biosynthesis protein TsaE
MTIFYHLDDLQAIMPQVLDALDGRRKIMLYGEMGAGKTTFAAAFCRHLGAVQSAASPTFSLINEYAYPLPNGKEGLIHHLDLYRLRNMHEAYDIGVEDLLFDEHYCLIEWPHIIEALLPEGIAKINIEIADENHRNIVILPS